MPVLLYSGKDQKIIAAASIAFDRMDGPWGISCCSHPPVAVGKLVRK
jgi:hypothetical protein